VVTAATAISEGLAGPSAGGSRAAHALDAFGLAYLIYMVLAAPKRD
jgi:hypothetical protein